MMNSRINKTTASGLQAIQWMLLIVYSTELIFERDLEAAFRTFLLMLYLEKLVAVVLRQTARVIDSSKYQLNEYDRFLKSALEELWLPNKSDVYRQLAKTIEKHPSCITKQAKPLEQFARESCKDVERSIPPTLKQMGHAIYNHFTWTINNFVIDAIATGQPVPHQHFTSLTYEEAENLIQALKKHPPYNYRITFGDKITQTRQAKITAIFPTDLTRAAWGCIAFQQGFRDQQSIVAMLPQEILNIIYAQVYPDRSSDQPHNRKNFINRVTSYTPGLFKRRFLVFKPEEVRPKHRLSITNS